MDWFLSYSLATRIWMIASLGWVILFLILWLLPFVRGKRKMGDPSWVSPLAICSGATLACLLALLGQLQSWNPLLTAAVALGAGGTSYLAVTYGNRALYRLLQEQQSEFSDLIGCDGMVWVPIPQGGVGKVQVLVSDRMLEIDAKSKDGQAKAVGTQVKILRQEGNIFTVA